MKDFFKNVLANIVAILLLGFILFGFFFLFIIAGALAGDKKPNIKNNSILTIDERAIILESDTESQTGIFNFKDKNKEIKLYVVVEAIKKAKNDDNIKGISIETDNINAGITQIDYIRKAIEDFKKSGKFVYAYGNNVSQASYYLGSVADQYFLHPAGGIELKGMSTEVTFFKEFADKYGIGLDVIRHGKFKAAVEPFMRNDISPENKEQLSTLLNDIWGETSNKIMASRKIAPEQFKLIVDSLYSVIPENSIKYKLADKLVQKSEYDDILKKKIGEDAEDDLNTVTINRYIRATVDENANADEQIAVLYASGQIFNGDEYNNIYSKKYVEYIKEIAEDDNIKALVFRINSPGGSANASDEILFELQNLKKKKPVIVSFGDYAASGGYYIAMAADKIYSEPNTLTGSIGVFGMIPNFKNLANKNGIRSDIVQTNENSQMFSPLSGASPGTIQIMTQSVEITYKRFVHFVTQNRKKSFEQVDELGGGRVWSGKRAKELGLVDELGSLGDAIAFAAKKTNSKDYGVVSYPRKVSDFEQFFGSMEDDEISTRIMKAKLGKDKYQLFESITNPNLQNSVQMQMPYIISIK